MPKALEHIRILELSTMITAPYAGMLLADMGADVIKIENPNGGDPYRSFRGSDYSPHFCAYNRNKRSVALDLRSEFGKDALHQLMRSSDVLIDNFRPGVLGRLGLTDDEVKRINPRLIHCSITGFGATGPYADRPAYDAVAQAVSGMSSVQIDPDDPRVSGPTIADNATGQTAAYGILTALIERERTGVARRVEVNMLDSAIAFIPDPFAYYTQMGLLSDPYLRARTSQSYVFRCQDGQLLAIHLSSQEKFWREFLTIVGRSDLASDVRFGTRDGRIENYEALRQLLQPVFECSPRSVWLKRLADHDLPFASVNSIAEVFDDPQVKHLETFFTLKHSHEGELRAIRRPVWFDGRRDDQPKTAPPRLGEHTSDVLRECGLDDPNKVDSTSV